MITTDERKEWIADAVARIWRAGGNVQACFPAGNTARAWSQDRNLNVTLTARPEGCVVEVAVRSVDRGWQPVVTRGVMKFADLGDAIKAFAKEAANVRKEQTT